MRRRVAVYGASEDAIALLPRLARQSGLELGAVFDPEARVLRRRLALIEPRAAALLQRHLTDDPTALAGDPALAWVVEGGHLPPFAQRFPALARRVRLSEAAGLAQRLGLDAAPAPEDGEDSAPCAAGLAILGLDDADAVAGETARQALALAGGGLAIVRLRGTDGRFPVRGRAVREGEPGAELAALEREGVRAALRARRPRTQAPSGSGAALWAGAIAARGQILGTLAVLRSGAGPLPARTGRRLECLAAFAGYALAALSPASRPASAPARDAVRPAFAAALARALAEGERRTGVVLSCRVETPATPDADSAARVRRVRRHAARALEHQLGPGDALDAGEDGPILALLREIAGSPSERITALVRAVAEDVVAREKGDDAPRTGLHFGYAVYPEDGDAPDPLLARARLPRIRML